MTQLAYFSRWARKTTSLILILSLLPPWLAAKTPGQTPEKMRAFVLKMGTGEKAQVKVRMKDGQTLKGYLSASDDAGFSLATKNQPRKIAYSEVASIGRKEMRPVVWAAIVVGGILGVLLVITAAAMSQG